MNQSTRAANFCTPPLFQKTFQWKYEYLFFLFVCLFVFLPITEAVVIHSCRSKVRTFLSVCLPVCLSVCLSVCLFNDFAVPVCLLLLIVVVLYFICLYSVYPV